MNPLTATKHLLVLILLVTVSVAGVARTKITAVCCWHYRTNNGTKRLVFSIDTSIYYRSDEGLISDSAGNPSNVLRKRIKSVLIDSSKTRIHRRYYYSDSTITDGITIFEVNKKSSYYLSGSDTVSRYINYKKRGRFYKSEYGNKDYSFMTFRNRKTPTVTEKLLSDSVEILVTRNRRRSWYRKHAIIREYRYVSERFDYIEKQRDWNLSYEAIYDGDYVIKIRQFARDGRLEGEYDYIYNDANELIEERYNFGNSWNSKEMKYFYHTE